MTSPPVVARVPSASHEGRRHAVRRFPSGLDCDCTAFSFSKTRRCSHTRLVDAALAVADRCLDAGHVRDPLAVLAGTVCFQCVVDLLAVAARKVKRDYVPKAKLAAQRAAKRERKKEAKRRGTETR